MGQWSGPIVNQRSGADARRKHGMSYTPTYRSWHCMIRRCTSPKDAAYPSYGGRGINVCKRWLVFENFLADMGKRPPGKSIERINNNGNYKPSNCKWATRKEQQNNRSANRLLTYNGQTMTVAQWSAKLSIRLPGLHARLSRGWPIERALAKYPMYILRSGNKSGFPGVHQIGHNLWRAQLRTAGTRFPLCTANTPAEAYMLRVRRAKQLGINLPEGEYFVRQIQSKRKRVRK